MFEHPSIHGYFLLDFRLTVSGCNAMTDGEAYEKILQLELSLGLYTIWELADLIHGKCMQKILPGNGARIAQLRRIAESKKHPLVGYSFHNDCQHLHIFKRDKK